MEQYTKIDKCRICGCKKLTEIVHFEPQYLSATFVKTNENNLLADIKIPQTLLFCERCSLVQLRETVNPDLLYRDYYYRTSVNETMKKDLKDLVDETVTRSGFPVVLDNRGSPYIFKGHRPVVVDLGANDATMLKMFPKDWTLIGVEPASNIERTREKEDPIYWILRDYFKADSTMNKINRVTQGKHRQADIITSCACFYDMDCNQATADIAKVLAPGGLAVIQVSHLLATVKDMNWIDVCFEHIVYYSLEVLDYLMERHGLSIVHATTNGVNGGSVRIFVRHKEEVEELEKSNEYWEIIEAERAIGLDSQKWFGDFRYNLFDAKKKILDVINKEWSSGGKVCGLGASTKGNVMIQTLGLTKKELPFFSERSIVKIGLRTLGTDIPMMSEEDARNEKPTMMFVLPWCFKGEIVEREKEYLESGGKLLFAIPAPYILDKSGEYYL